MVQCHENSIVFSSCTPDFIMMSIRVTKKCEKLKMRRTIAAFFYHSNDLLGRFSMASLQNSSEYIVDGYGLYEVYHFQKC